MRKLLPSAWARLGIGGDWDTTAAGAQHHKSAVLDEHVVAKDLLTAVRTSLIPAPSSCSCRVCSGYALQTDVVSRPAHMATTCAGSGSIGGGGNVAAYAKALEEGAEEI